jgi:hypothetical protein
MTAPVASPNITLPTGAPSKGAGSDAAELVEAARLILSRMGLRPEDLIDGAPAPVAGPVMDVR